MVKLNKTHHSHKVWSVFYVGILIFLSYTMVIMNYCNFKKKCPHLIKYAKCTEKFYVLRKSQLFASLSPVLPSDCGPPLKYEDVHGWQRSTFACTHPDALSTIAGIYRPRHTHTHTHILANCVNQGDPKISEVNEDIH